MLRWIERHLRVLPVLLPCPEANGRLARGVAPASRFNDTARARGDLRNLRRHVTHRPFGSFQEAVETVNAMPSPELDDPLHLLSLVASELESRRTNARDVVAITFMDAGTRIVISTRVQPLFTWPVVPASLNS